MSIHPTAIVDPAAKIGRGVEIGAFSIVGPNVALGDGCKIRAHAIVEGYTTLGEGCEVFPQAVLGLEPQDLKFRGERTTLEIGRNNTFREMVTVHPGTGNGGGVTHIGDDSLFLIGVHIAHDCHIGDRCILANYVQLAGHVRVEEHVNIGGHTAVHHFVSIGKHAFIGGMTRIPADVPPFMVVVAARGTRSEVRMVNGVGLQRSGYGSEDINDLKEAFVKIFARRARMSGVPIRDRVQHLLDREELNPHVKHLCDCLMRSFAHGRHGRYLESLRADPVCRDSWKPKNNHTLTIHVVGSGVVERDHAPTQTSTNAKPHDVVKLRAMAKAGWRFAGWEGNLTGLSNPASVTLDSDKRITATFSETS